MKKVKFYNLGARLRSVDGLDRDQTVPCSWRGVCTFCHNRLIHINTQKRGGMKTVTS